MAVRLEARTAGRFNRHGQRPFPRLLESTNAGRCRPDARGRHVPAVSSAVTTVASDRAGPRAAAWRPHSVGPNLSLETSASRRKGSVWDLLAHVDCLGMLSEVVEAGESSAAVTLERSFARVFATLKSQFSTDIMLRQPSPFVHMHVPNVTSQVLAPGEAQLTRRELGAEESLSLLLLRRPLRLARGTFVIGPVLFPSSAFFCFCIGHVYILRLSRCLRCSRALRPGDVRGLG